MSGAPGIARVIALEVVTRVRERGAYAHETLHAIVDGRDLDGRDLALATRLAYGTVASRGTLDEAIARFATRPERLEPRVADALALSAYELLFTRTPARAAVNEGVELVRGVQPRAAGLANAVLRKLAAAVDEFPWGDPDTDTAALARLHAHPLWLAEQWIRELGRERAAEVMAANNEPAPLYLATLPFHGDEDALADALNAEGAVVSPCPIGHCLRAEAPGAALASESLRRRDVVVADAAAQFAAHAVRARPGQVIVELGAGRGTKSLIVAADAVRAGGAADVVAVDLHGFKLDETRRAAEITGAPGIRTVAADATDPEAGGLPAPGTADAVFVDAPCSGLGTLRRHPDRRWKARPEEIEALAALGSAMLHTAARLVKPGGFVVYSTCTITNTENAEVIGSFLASSEGRGFTVDPLSEEVFGPWLEFVNDNGWFQSVPRTEGPDGHFVCRLRRMD